MGRELQAVQREAGLAQTPLPLGHGSDAVAEVDGEPTRGTPGRLVPAPAVTPPGKSRRGVIALTVVVGVLLVGARWAPLRWSPGAGGREHDWRPSALRPAPR